MLSRPRCAQWVWPALAACLLAAAAWPRITAGFWTDEAGTWWMVKDRLSDAVARAEWWSATSPLYYALAWAWAQLFGLGEISLRLPSLLLIIASAALIFRLARFWLDREGAWLAAVYFLMSRFVAFAAIDARPYALGLVLLLAAWVLMLGWLERGGAPRGALFVLCAAGAVWAHYTFALGLLPLAWYLARLGWRRSLAAALGGALLLAPRVYQMAEVAGRRGQLTFARPPDALDAALAILPVEFVALAGLLCLAAAFASWRRRRGAEPDFVPWRVPRTLLPVLLLAVLPPAALFLLSRSGGMEIFVPRYMLSREVGLALLSAWLVRGFTRFSLRASTTCAAALLSMGLFLSGRGHSTDWRGASQWAAMHAASAVAVTSGFVESNVPGALADPTRREILFAPQSLYPLPGRPILLPLKFNGEARAILEQAVVPAARERGSLVVIAGPMSVKYREPLERRLRGEGLALVEERNFEGVRGWLFRPPTRP